MGEENKLILIYLYFQVTGMVEKLRYIKFVKLGE